MGELETTVEADALAAVVGGLTPHTEYSVSVEGRTEGGGDGESSDTVSVTTPEAGECCTKFHGQEDFGLPQESCT